MNNEFMKKLNLLVLLIAVSLFSACTDNQEMQSGTLIDITLTGVVNNTETRVTYDPEDGSVSAASWELGDEVSIVVPGSSGNDNQKFAISTAAAMSDMSGKVATWEGSKSVYAIYPFSANGYTVDAPSESIIIDHANHEIDANAGNKYPNGLMVAIALNSTAVSKTDNNIAELNFKQVMSLYKLSVKDIPAEEQITAMSFEVVGERFVATADINASTGRVNSKTRVNSVTATVKNQSGPTASLNFSLIPVNLTGISVSIFLTTTSEIGIKRYVHVIAEGINFQANKFMNTNDVLSLTNDFIETTSGEFKLADFKDDFIPDGDKWVIIDDTATDASFEGLKETLTVLNIQKKTVSLVFPNLSTVPDYALEDGFALVSATFPKATSVGYRSFNGCRALASVSIPLATTIGTEAFYDCTLLTDIQFPLITSIEASTFYSCEAVTAVSFPLVTSIAEGAFSNCVALTSATFPLATSIGSNAFDSCNSLTTMSFPNVAAIGIYSFSNCTSLATAMFPLVTKIEENTFLHCKALTTISFPAVTSIEHDAFSGCPMLKTVTFPMVTSIGDYAFFECSSLTAGSFPIVTMIGSNVLEGCDALRNLELSTGTDVVLESLGVNVFRIDEETTNEANITLKIGVKNQPNIQTNTLTVTENAYTFKEITTV